MPQGTVISSGCRFILPLALCLACLFPITAIPGTFVELESTYLNDGWFQYRVKMFPELYFDRQTLTGAGTISFTNWMETGSVPIDWEFVPPGQPGAAMWAYTNTPTRQPLPYERVFLVKSSQLNFKQSTSFYASISFSPASWMHSPYLTGNAAGYVKLPCLVPCPPGEADGSPPYLLKSEELFPDVQINGLSPSTLSYEWEADCTLLIQGNSNLTRAAWTNIGYAFGCLGTTTWTSSVPLSAYGSCFRVGVVSLRRETNWVNP